MKTLAISCAFLGAAAFSPAVFSQIPVTDGASIAQSVVQQVETIAKWKLQYDQMMSQIEQAK